TIELTTDSTPHKDSFLCGLFLVFGVQVSSERRMQEQAPALPIWLCYTRPHVFWSEKTVSCRCDGTCLPRFLCTHASAAHRSRWRSHKRPFSIRKHPAAADQGLPAGLHRNCF